MLWVVLITNSFKSSWYIGAWSRWMTFTFNYGLWDQFQISLWILIWVTMLGFIRRVLWFILNHIIVKAYVSIVFRRNNYSFLIHLVSYYNRGVLVELALISFFVPISNGLHLMIKIWLDISRLLGCLWLFPTAWLNCMFRN